MYININLYAYVDMYMYVYIVRYLSITDFLLQAQQMCHRLDQIADIKRIEQPTGISPVVLFKYKANPSLPLTLELNGNVCLYIMVLSYNLAYLSFDKIVEENNNTHRFYYSIQFLLQVYIQLQKYTELLYFSYIKR